MPTWIYVRIYASVKGHRLLSSHTRHLLVSPFPSKAVRRFVVRYRDTYGCVPDKCDAGAVVRGVHLADVAPPKCDDPLQRFVPGGPDGERRSQEGDQRAARR
eukprot:486126-Prorocentrum_minimum.AAC.1